MKDYTLVVYSNPAPGREDEYNDWYNNQHLKDVLAQPAFISARRFCISEHSLSPEMPQPAHRYVAFYNMRTNDPQKALDDMRERVEQGIIGLSDAMDENFLAYCYEAASPMMESN